MDLKRILCVVVLLAAVVPAGGGTRPAIAPAPAPPAPMAAAPQLPPLVAHFERPRTYDVDHYRIDLRFDETAQRVSGSTTVRLEPLEDDFRTLELDAANLNVASVRLERGAPLKFEVDPAAEKLRVSLNRVYKAGEPLSVTVAYTASPKKGIYFYPSGGPKGSPAQFWSQGETSDNHHWFPCWDFPNDKATSEVAMTINRRWAGLSNGALVGTRINRDGTKTLRWRQDTPISSYLIMVAAGDFAEVTDTWRGKPVTYVVPRADAGDARKVFGRTPEMMEYFSKAIGVDYPWAKYSQIAISHFMFGGMENTSATTLSDLSLFGGDTTPPEDDTEGLVAHELAHQWFGDLVTCRDWAHAWLNEGFATYFALLWAEHAHGRDAFNYGVYEQSLEHLRSGAAVRRPLVYNVYRQPFDLFFDGTIYPKGAWVLHMLRRVVGDEAFWKGIHGYATKYQYGLATTDDFRGEMEAASGQRLDWFFDEWTAKAGYPEFDVTTSWNEASKTLEMRVRQTQQVTDVVPIFRMPVDVRLVTPSGAKVETVTVDAPENVFTFQLDAKPSLVTFDADNWVLKRLTFAKSVDELSYQLEHDPDVAGRIWAAVELSRAEDPRGVEAIARSLSGDPFFGVRVQAARLLSRSSTQTARAALNKATSDQNSEVRQAATEGLRTIR